MDGCRWLWVVVGGCGWLHCLVQPNKATHFSKDITKSSFMVLYCGKNSFNYHETPPVKRVHFDVEFPCFGN